MATRDVTVVVFADAAYRNGYNFDVDVVVDCGTVREEYIADGSVRFRYRHANMVEIMQGTARVGRFKEGLVFRNALDYPTHVPMLSLGEVRHAAAMHILLGFKPPIVLSNLEPCLAEWSFAEALYVIRRYLSDIVVVPGDHAAVGTTDDAPIAVPMKPAVSGSRQRSSREPTLRDVIDRARCLSLEEKHVDDVFTLCHPGVRYDVPRSYSLVEDPYWVKPADAERMIRRLLSGSGRYDVAMLKTDEVHWFAARLTSSWNSIADGIAERSLALSAVDEAVNSNVRIHSHVWHGIRQTRDEVAVMVRELEALMDLMRQFYVAKPFLVQVRDISDEPVAPARRESAKYEVDKFVLGSSNQMVGLGTNVGPHRLIDTRPSGCTPYTWSSERPRCRKVVQIMGGSSSSGSNRG
ncbi:hypothetical protein ACFFON_17105, partial [Arthrobacter citreus]|uniref:hypothetical protein n=1 Tax=Arthrobacter citreus TaxID=1670 RepID=UPI0035E65C2A